ncbi:ankyrin repeat [Chlorella sorokiniana]|uniref:Ankyrin repeat n=1 Tax=Chlorella sorokiniana TaxID=3076 RepID=A0A2P6TXU8_CHLSO|nr:ankyrin repeat [Chlorella sorokiniana]|eukprot:PRW58881.1 ankyrin repeat [Chlorella sorokiniana]
MARPPPRNFSPESILTCAKNNDAAGIRVLVEAGVPPQFCNQIGQTALHVAALWGSVEAAKELLDQGADVNCENARGSTPLHFAAAAKSRTREICELLLDAGADTGFSDLQGRMPYEMAESDEIRALLDGPDPRIFSCAAAGDVAGLRQLFEEEPDHDTDVFNGEGVAPLHLAARGGHMGAVAFLLQRKSFVDMQDFDGNSALHHAVREGHQGVVQLLLRNKANPNVRNFSKSEYASGNWLSGGKQLQPLHQTPVHVAAEAGDTEMAQLLLKAGAEPSAVDFDGKTALHHALEMQDDDMAELLIDSGADINLGSKDFASPLHQAAGSGMLQVLRLLLRKGADANAADEAGWTPLMLAVRSSKLPAVEALLEAGADAAAQNKQGATAIHLAAVNGKPPICSCLAQRAPAALAVRNAEGKTAAEVAKTPEVAALLAPPV